MNFPQKEFQKSISDAFKDQTDFYARKQINEEFRKRLSHYIEHNDIRPLNSFVSKIPERDMRNKILKYISENLLFRLNDEGTGLVPDKIRTGKMTPQVINRFNLMDVIALKKSSKGVFYIDCEKEIGTEEFVSWLADTLTLRRREFSHDHVEYLIEILSMIKSQTSNKDKRQGSN